MYPLTRRKGGAQHRDAARALLGPPVNLLPSLQLLRNSLCAPLQLLALGAVRNRHLVNPDEDLRPVGDAAILFCTCERPAVRERKSWASQATARIASRVR